MEPQATEQEELHAFLDGEMDRETAVKFAASVAASPVLAREVARLRADKALLVRAYGGIESEPIPDRLLAPFRRHAERRRFARFAVACSAAAALAALVWFAPPLLRGDRLVEEALAARQGTMSDARPIAAAVLSSADQRDEALDGVLSLPVKVPSLESSGYQLVAVTLFKAAAQISYQDGQGRLFTLYLRPTLGADRFAMQRRGSVEICVWQNAELAVAMVGEMSTRDMLKLASATYADLDL